MEETASTDALRNPYIERQEILTEAFGHAFAQKWGLRAIGSPTGSGKNFTSSRAIAKLHVRNWRAWKDGELDGDCRPYVVISLSGRANRSDFAKMVADAVVAEADGEIDAEAAEGMVIDLASLSDGLTSYLFGGSEGQEAIAAAPKKCPFRSDDKAQNKELESCWSAAVEAAENLQRFGSVSSAMRQQLSGMLTETEYRLRCLVRSLYYNAEKGVEGPRLTVGRDTVLEIWPAARLGEPGPKVIVATPNKLMMPIDTFSEGSISLISADFAKRAVYLFDEIDKAKSDFLTAIISNRSADYQPDDLVRILVARFLEGAEGTSPLLKGDPQAWRGLLFSARKERFEAAGEEGKDPMTLAQVDAASAKVSERFGKTQGALFAVHGELRLDLPFKTDDALAGDGRDSRHLFSRTDGVHLFGTKGARRVYAAPDEATQRNVLSTEKGYASSDQAELSAILGRCEGVVRSTLSFFAFCVRTIDRIYEGCPLHSRDTSIKMVVDAAGFHSTKNRDQEIWKRLISDRLFAQEPPSSEKTEDVSLYTTGDGYYRIEDSEAHKLTSYVSNDSVPYLPEAVLATIAQNAPVAIMSATWSAPTVKNWNYAYLREIRGVMPADPEMDSLNSAIDRETRRLNARIAGEYEVNARQIPAAGQIVRLAGCLGPTSIGSPDEAQAAAREFLRGLCASESDVELCMSQLLGDAAFSIAASAEGGDASFSFRRISKYLQVAGIWGSSVADGRHYAGLALTMPLVSLTVKEPQNRLYAQLMTTIAVGWAKTGRGGFAGIDAPADCIVFASSADWNDRWHTAKASLESGVPTLIVTPLANAGFSKNLQYRVPSCLDGLTTTLDYGYDMPPGIRPEVDFDCIFIENPTNRLQSTMQFDAPKWREGTLRGIIEQDELADRGEIDLPAKKSNRQRLLSGNKNARPKISDLESFCAEGGRIIAQAVGRIVRSRTKFLNVDILFDEEIAKSCDFGFLERGTNALELEALLDAIGEAEEPCRPLVPTREEIAARRGVIANALEHERHVTLVRRLMRDNPDEKAKDDFESHRIRTLRNFNPGQEDVEADRACQNYLVKAPWPVCGYAYAARGDAGSVNAFDIEFPLPDEDTTDAALERIKARRAKERGARFDVVSLGRARFGQILAIPEVARYFEAQEYRTDYPGKAVYFYTPYAFISEFLGVLGEAAGYAILDAAFGDAYVLDRGEAAQAERGGDFEVLTRDGRRTRVWLDFKHYSMAAYLGRSSAEDEAAKFERKADSVSAKALIVVNLLADDAAEELAPRPLVGGRVWSIPYLVHDGKVDDRSIMILKGLIDARADFE